MQERAQNHLAACFAAFFHRRFNSLSALAWSV